MIGRPSRVGFIAARVKAKLAETGAACVITLTWKVLTGGTLDARTGSTIGATSTTATTTAKAFVHFVQIGSFVVRDYAEVEVGDAILDFAPDVAIDGKHELVFEFNGAKWSQKPMSAGLAQHWDTVIGDTRILRSVLVRKL